MAGGKLRVAGLEGAGGQIAEIAVAVAHAYAPLISHPAMPAQGRVPGEVFGGTLGLKAELRSDAWHFAFKVFRLYSITYQACSDINRQSMLPMPPVSSCLQEHAACFDVTEHIGNRLD